MKTTINKLFILIIATTLITLVTACDSSTLHQTLDNSDSETFIITGTISLNNVAASKVAIDETTANARQASSSFKISNDKYSYSVIAVQGDKTVNATISNSEDNYTYTLSLDSRGKWTIKAYLYYEEELIAQAEEEITISETATNGSSIPGSIILTFTPQINSSKQGAINLAIKNQVSDTASITLHWINGENTGLTVPTDQTKTITSSDQIVVFTYNSVTSDIYNVEIIFKNSTGKELYTCFETINVFANWTTDTWGGKSAYLNDKNEFVFSDTLKDSYAQKPHVFENSSEDPLFLLWSASPTESGIPEQALATNAVGSQVFDSVTEGMTITKPLECGYNYCFVDSTLYVPPYRYIQSYAGYTKDSSFDMTTLIPAPAVWFPENVNCLLLDDFVYFIFTLYNENDYTDYYFVGRYNTKDDSVIMSPTPFNSSDSQRCTSLAVTHSYNPVDLETDPSSGVLYIVIEGYDMTLNETVLTLHRKPFKVVHDANGDVDYMVTEGLTYGEDDIKPASININDFDKTFKFGGSYFTVTDMTVLEDKLYVLIATEGLTTSEYQGDQVIYTKNSQQEYEPSLYGFRSNGGILKFDVTSTAKDEDDFVPLSWGDNINPNTNNKIFGLYTLSNEIKYYANYSYGDVNDPDFNQINTTPDIHDPELPDWIVPVQPPITQANNYFYGPRKILATKTNQLIIADDGGYFEATGFIGDRSKNFNPILRTPENRIVTVDLQNSSITSVVDVGATFTSSYRSNKFYFSTSQN